MLMLPLCLCFPYLSESDMVNDLPLFVAKMAKHMNGKHTSMKNKVTS